MAGFETVVLEIEVEPGLVAPRHSHPGVESTYVIAGHADLIIEWSTGAEIAGGRG